MDFDLIVLFDTQNLAMANPASANPGAELWFDLKDFHGSARDTQLPFQCPLYVEPTA